MKICYSRSFILLIIALASLNVSSQKLEFLDANNVKAGIGIGGNLFSMLADTAKLPFGAPDTNNTWRLFEVPKGQGTGTEFTSSLWMNAYDANGNLHSTAQKYREGGGDLFNGPVAAVYNMAYDSYYKRVFKVTRTQIIHHLSLNFPLASSQVDPSLLQWPGKGNPFVVSAFSVSIADKLAPYIDVDADGIYDPSKGDYPAFCGEEAIFFVLNDARRSHETGCMPLGVEIRGLAEEFVDVNAPLERSAINNTVFVRYEIENKSASDYSGFCIGKLDDVELGCFDDDRVGCDSSRNLMYVYNSYVPEQVNCNGLPTYGNTRVSFGVKFLDQYMNTFNYFANSGFAITDPTTPTCSVYPNYLTGHWGDGTSFTYGVTGYGGTTPTNYIFSGDPDQPGSFTDVSSPNTPGDRLMLGSTNPVGFLQGETKHFDLAFTASYSQDTNATSFTIVDTLKRDADIVQQFYNNLLLNCSGETISTGLKDVTGDLNVGVFPVPVHDQLSVTSEGSLTELELYDLQGRLVTSKHVYGRSAVLDVSGLARSLYVLKIKAGTVSTIRKVDLQ